MLALKVQGDFDNTFISMRRISNSKITQVKYGIYIHHGNIL